MATKKKKTLYIIIGLLVIAGVAIAVMSTMQQVDHSPPRLIGEKKAQLKALDKLAAKHKAFADKFNPVVRDTSLRDTGHKGVGLFIRDAYFRIVGGIAFDVDKLSALLVPNDSSDPIIIDDPTSFVFKPLNGSVVMPPKALTALFNQYLADYPDSPMRNLSVKTQPGKLAVDGEVSKVSGLWLPFHMAGPVKLVKGHLFVFNPKKIEIEGIGQKGLLNLVNLSLQNLLQIKTSGAKLTGNNITLDLNHSLPPPEQDVNVSKMSIDKAGVHLTFSSDQNPSFPPPIVKTKSYVMMQGGDLKTFRAVLTDVRLEMVAKGGGKLDASLYNYRQQILTGYFDATPAGSYVAYLGPEKPADYVPPAQPKKNNEKNKEKNKEKNNGS